MRKFIAIAAAVLSLGVAAPQAASAAVGVVIRTPGARIMVGNFYYGGRHYRHRAWNCVRRYGRRACAWRYYDPIVVAGPGRGYYWHGRHWKNRLWKCEMRYGRRACAYRYW